MNRVDALKQLADSAAPWEVLVIGGGATGLGVAVDAAARGYRTVLIERQDFAQATSSRSTKLIHGGFRYLKQGNVSLVRESLRERGLLLRNAPHLVHPLSFVVPAYRWWEQPYYGAGLKLYDAMSGRLSLGRSRLISREETLRLLPTLAPDGLRGGVRYLDGQFDDARLALCLAQTVFDLGGLALNYLPVLRLLKEQGRMRGVIARDLESNQEFELHARVVVNATGIFTDETRQLDDPKAPRMMTVSQGTHVVLDRSFLPGETALMVPQTDDGRILFAIPWQGRVLVGTTDTPISAPEPEPVPQRQEIEFLLAHARRYLSKAPGESDILSTFAGLRPLVRSGDTRDTAKLARDHVLSVSPSSLVTITGGKWTTYRQMAEDAVDQAAEVGGLEKRPSPTRELRLHGWTDQADAAPDATSYGTDAEGLRHLSQSVPDGNVQVHSRLPYRSTEVLWATRHEMARTVEDVLARRTRALILDAQASMEIAPGVAKLMAAELGRDESWQQQQVKSFHELARGYLPAGCGARDTES